MTSYFETNSGTYSKVGDYYLPDLTLPYEPEYDIGRFGLMRRHYLKNHRKGLFSSLLMSGRLNEHLAEIDQYLTIESGYNTVLYGDEIYHSNYYGYLYQTNLKTKKTINWSPNGEDVVSFDVFNNNVYYSGRSMGSSSPDGIWRKSIEGGQSEKIFNGYAATIQIANNKLWFYGEGSSLYCMDLNGSNIRNVTNSINVNCFNILDNGDVYYTGGTSRQLNLLSGSKNTVVIDNHSPNKLCIVGNWLYFNYEYMDEQGRYVLAKRDGTIIEMF